MSRQMCWWNDNLYNLGTYLVTCLPGHFKEEKIGMEAFQNNPILPTIQEHHCQWRPALWSIFSNSIFFSLFSRSQEIHLIPYVKAKMNEMNKDNASALLGHECNSKHGKVATLCLLYWAYEGDVLCKTGFHTSYIWDTSKAEEYFLHVQDPTVGPLHFDSTPFRMSLMQALEAEQWILRKTGLIKHGPKSLNQEQNKQRLLLCLFSI